MKTFIKIAVFLTLFFSPLLFLWYFLSAPTATVFSGQYTPASIPSNLQKHVIMLSETLPARSDDVDKLDVSAAYIHQIFSQYSQNTAYQTFEVWGIPYKNVIAQFGPKTDQPIYVIGAHYDSYKGLSGADDNASGVAGLLELARLLSTHTLTRQVQLVAYALEEPPYFRTDDMGSFHHAKQLKEHNITVALMLSLEMIGYFSDDANSQTFPLPFLDQIYPNTGNFIALVSAFEYFQDLNSYDKCMTSGRS